MRLRKSDPHPPLPCAVYFVGAEGVGKTTLARSTDALLRRRGYAVKPMITEVARAVQSRLELDISALRADAGAVNRYQREIFLSQYAEERSRDFSGYIADRALADNLCYLAEYGTDLYRLLEQERSIIDDYKPRLRKACVFHVTPQRAIYDGSKQADGVRAVVPWDGIVRIDAMLKLLLKLWDVRPCYIQSANAAEREEQIAAVLSAVLQNAGTAPVPF